MSIKKILITISFLFNTIIILGQGFSYTFTDPCTFKQKQIYIDNPSGSVLLTYNGSTQSFTQQQLQSGSLEQWITQVNSSNPNGPCSGIGLAQNTNMNVLITQNNIAVLTNVMSALNDIRRPMVRVVRPLTIKTKEMGKLMRVIMETLGELRQINQTKQAETLIQTTEDNLKEMVKRHQHQVETMEIQITQLKEEVNRLSRL